MVQDPHEDHQAKDHAPSALFGSSDCAAHENKFHPMPPVYRSPERRDDYFYNPRAEDSTLVTLKAAAHQADHTRGYWKSTNWHSERE